MTIEQTIEIPPSRLITIKVPEEIPAGKAMLTLTAISTSHGLGICPIISFDTNISQSELKVKLQKLQGSLGKKSFCALDGVAYQHKVRKEWDD